MNDNNEKKTPIEKASDKIGFKVSLMPSEVRLPSPVFRLKLFYYIFVISVGTAFTVSAVLWLIVLVKRGEVMAAEKTRVAIEQKTSALATTYDTARREQDKIDALSSVFASHVYATRVFAFLEKNTLPQVSWDNLNFTSGGVISMTATAADYTYLVAQVETIKSDPAVDSVTFSGVNGDFDSDHVQMSAKFNIIIALKPSYLVGPDKSSK